MLLQMDFLICAVQLIFDVILFKVEPHYVSVGII